MILTKEQIREKRNKFIQYNSEQLKKLEETTDLHEHMKKYDFFKSKLKTPGQYFLYECFLENNRSMEITYPKIGIYTFSYICDQTLEVEWIDTRRTWEHKTEYEYIVKNKNGEERKFTDFAAENRTELKSLILWHDSLLVYGAWDAMPNWKQLRQSYERTWWFKRGIDEIRDIQIDRIFK